MLIMDPRAFGGFEELLLQCAAYGARTGGRFLACDFEKDVTRGEEVRDAWDSVEAFKEKIRLAAHDERSELVVQYVAAYRETLHEAALQTMAAALASVDRFQGSNAASAALAGALGVDDVSLDVIRSAPFEELAVSVRAVVAARGCDKQRSARLRAASFVSDFGAAQGLARVPCPHADEMLACFFARLDAEFPPRAPPSPSSSSSGEDPQPPRAFRPAEAMAAAFAPYRELFAATASFDRDSAHAWVAKHPEETAYLSLAIGGLALAAGILLGALRTSTPKPRR